MKTLYSLLFTAIASFAPAAFAQHAGHDAHDHGAHPAQPAASAATTDVEAAFKRLDGNGDGFLTRQELPANHALLPHFDMSDANRDGRLDANEFKRGMSML
ncbi:EF-hand domain-containing protein [Stenotrophomonas acidaminiphila]